MTDTAAAAAATARRCSGAPAGGAAPPPLSALAAFTAAAAADERCGAGSDPAGELSPLPQPPAALRRPLPLPPPSHLSAFQEGTGGAVMGVSPPGAAAPAAVAPSAGVGTMGVCRQAAAAAAKAAPLPSLLPRLWRARAARGVGGGQLPRGQLLGALSWRLRGKVGTPGVGTGVGSSEGGRWGWRRGWEFLPLKWAGVDLGPVEDAWNEWAWRGRAKGTWSAQHTAYLAGMRGETESGRRACSRWMKGFCPSL